MTKALFPTIFPARKSVEIVFIKNKLEKKSFEK